MFAPALDDTQALGVGGKVGDRVVCLAAMIGNREMVQTAIDHLGSLRVLPLDYRRDPRMWQIGVGLTLSLVLARVIA